ncbi:MAG: hypothetical protein WD942_06015 [Dehalococcoidia bacterium]
MIASIRSRHQRWSRVAILTFALAMTVLQVGAATVAQAQEPPAAPAEGAIIGQVILGTDTATLDPGTSVELIELLGTSVTTRRAPVAPDGTYAFAVPVNPEVRYVPRVEYQGVQYFGAPIILTLDAPSASVDPIVVYESTDSAPELTIRETVMTAIALDRREGQIGFIREDLVVNPDDRAYVGGADRITLRIPAPEATLDAAGENADGQFALQDGILTTTTPIRALHETALITRFLIDYDTIQDRYGIRVTVPVATDRIILRIPHDYVRHLRPEGGARLGPDEMLTVASGDPVPLYTVVLEDARPGDSLVATLDGLAVQVNRNPIAETPGSVIASLVAFVALLAVGSTAILYSRRRADDPGDA